MQVLSAIVAFLTCIYRTSHLKRGRQVGAVLYNAAHAVLHILHIHQERPSQSQRNMPDNIEMLHSL